MYRLSREVLLLAGRDPLWVTFEAERPEVGTGPTFPDGFPSLPEPDSLTLFEAGPDGLAVLADLLFRRSLPLCPHLTAVRVLTRGECGEFRPSPDEVFALMGHR